MMMDGFFFKTLGPRLKLGRRRRSGRDMGATLAMEALEHRVLLAVTPLRLADIALGEESSDPSQFIDVNGIVYFTASDGEAGTELWRTDGTDEGTLLVKELRFGSPYGYPAGSNPDSLTNVNGTLFFVADDGENGPELWKSDGTEEGTVLVRDINPRTLETDDYAFGSSPSNLIDVNGTLFFTADDGQHGEELWKSDGTTDGTVLVKDINPAESFGYAYGSEPSYLTAINGTLYFAANDGLNGKELWKSDGTSDGTVLVKDINPNQIEDYAYGSQISNLTNVNGTLFFAANEGEHGIELWKSDGTTDGTVLVRDINPEMAEDYAYGRGYGSSPANLTSVNGMLLFTADDGQTGSELWKSDGTVEGTVLVKDIFPGMGYSYFYNDVNDYGYTYGPYASSPQDLIPSESTGTLFFTADDGIVGRELWKSDGTEEGTVLVADLTPDDYPTYILYPTEVDGTLFFVADIADGPVVGRELWRSDGTQHGTALVADINPGEGGSYPHNLAEVNGTLFFAASDDANGVEPWTVEPGSIVRGSVFLDINANGLQDSDDVGLQAVGLFVDQNGNGQLDPSEPTASTDFNGNYAFAVDEGVHILRLQSTSGFVQTVPAGLAGHTVTVGDEDVAEQFNFGLELIAPESVDLLDITDSGISSTDNVTNFNNSSPELAPQFLVSGVARTSFVRVRVDGEQLGVIFTDQENATVTLDGRALIEDGTHTAVADIILPSSGHEGPTTEPISFTVDTSEPVFGRPPDVTLAQVDQPFVFEATSQDMTTVTYSLAAGPTGMAVDEAGVVRWTPTLQQQGPQSFEVEAVDAAGNSARQMIEMTVLGVIPAFPDSLDAIEDETLVIDAEMGVLANDGDEQSGVLTAMIVSEPAHGTLQLNADGSLTYAPNPNFNGTDRFTYFATDGEDDTNEATVTVNVAPVNDAPEAMDDAFDAGEDQFLSVEVGIGVLANDVDVDGDEITAVLLQQPSHGSISLNPDGSFTYEPDDDFSGTDSFTYRVNDGSLESEVATVTIEVAPLNDPPIAGNDSFQTDEDSMLDVAADAGLLINDSDVDSDTLSAILVNGPTNGTVSINDDGSFSYSPIADFFGVDTFTYTATDGEAESAVATVTIDVTARPDPPSPVGDRFDVPADSETQTFAVLDNDSDPDGDQTLSVVAVSQSSAGGTVTITEDGLAVEYTPPAGFVGLDTFSYTVEDSDSLTREATVQVTVTQSASNSLSGFVYIDGNNDGQRGDGEMGVPGSILTLSGVDSQGNRSELSVLTNDDGSYRFEEVPSGTFDLVQHQPESLWDAETTTGTHGGDVSDNRISNIMLDGDQSAVDYNFGELGLRAKYISVSLHLASTPADHVVLRGLLANGEEEAGNFDLAQAIRDARSDVELPPPDRILRASNDEYQLREDELLAVDAAMGLLSNDDDGDTLTAVLVRGPERGQLSLTGDGSFTYSPDTDFSGVDTFTYRSTDGNVESNEVTVTLAVDPVADPPVANADEYQVVDGEILDIGQAQGVLANDSDPDGDDLMAELVAPTFNGDVSLSGDGSFIYTPNDDFDGFDEFVYRASDGTSVSQDQTVTITSRPAVLDEAPDLVAFAQALSASGTTMFGAAWCPHCTAQKEAFEDGQHFVPFVEVTNPDRTPNQIAIDNNVVSYPTWEFPDGTRLRGQQDLQTLSERSGVPIPTSSTPFLLPIDDVTLLAGSPLHIPLDGYDPNGGRLTYSVSSDNSLVRAEVIPDNPSMRISVSGYGDMVFELFQGRARRVTDQIIELAETGFYDFVSFHRIIDGFVVQGGDPTGTGSGGSPLGDFDDQFHVDLQHNRTGILSMAKTTDDTNDSQFFITEGPQRFLDFNHSIFGQMIEGFENFAAITSVPTGAGDSPVDPVVMQSVEVFEDEENALLMLKAPEASIGEATITVTVKDEDGQIFERSINVTIEPDTRNGGPFLADIPQMQTSVDTPITFQLVGMDVEGDAIRYEARQVGEVDYAVEFDQSTGVVTVTPPAGFVGEFQVEVRVRPETFSDTNDLYDSQLVDFVVTT